MSQFARPDHLKARPHKWSALDRAQCNTRGTTFRLVCELLSGVRHAPTPDLLDFATGLKGVPSASTLPCLTTHLAEKVKQGTNR